MKNKIVKQNLKAIKKAEKDKGYKIESKENNYNSFAPHPYASISDIIEEIVTEKGICRILELGPGKGEFASTMSKKFGESIDYEVVDFKKPKTHKGLRKLLKHNKKIRWTKNDFDTFESKLEYDIILSINGLVYGCDDKKNLFKYINSLSKNGRLLFNFYHSNWNDIIIEKNSTYREVLSLQFLDALNEQNMNSYIDKASFGSDISWIFYGIRQNDQPLNENSIKTRANELKSTRTTSYIDMDGSQKWISMKDIKTAPVNNIRKAIQEEIKNLNNEERTILKQTKHYSDFILNEQEFVYSLIEYKIPVNLYVKKMIKTVINK
ncbi:MAG: class I SAM-dependent methyltransferase [Nanoarchaeota archaeon]|nr:class I SAM-dependent methyltransferase [Nanoarchaeota archaeon]MBU1854495.1 class I SAM-dependent methyltransferase [Nanoarchaeota archaeon]